MNDIFATITKSQRETDLDLISDSQKKLSTKQKDKDVKKYDIKDDAQNIYNN